MILKTHIPKFPLNHFIDCFIYYEGYHPGHSIDRFLPDGNTEIIIDFDDRPQHIYDNQTLEEIQACHHVWASGVRTEFISIPSGKHAAIAKRIGDGASGPRFWPASVGQTRCS